MARFNSLFSFETFIISISYVIAHGCAADTRSTWGPVKAEMKITEMKRRLPSRLVGGGLSLIGSRSWVVAPIEGAIGVFDLTGGKEVRRLDLKGEIVGVATADNGSRIAAATRDGVIRIWRASDWTLEHSLSARIRRGGLYLSPDGKRLFYAGSSEGNSLCAVDTTRWSSLEIETDETVNSLCFAGSRTFFATDSGVFELLNDSKGFRKLMQRPGTLISSIRSLSVDSSAKYFAVGTSSGQCAAIDVRKREIVWDSATEFSDRAFSAVDSQARFAVFSASGPEGKILFYDLTSHKKIVVDVPSATGRGMREIVISRDGDLVVADMNNGTIGAWSVTW